MLQSVRTQIGMIVRGKFDGRGLLRRLGYSRDELITHIERQFARGMTWANYGMNGTGWELDHIRPCASFDLTDDAQFAECWSLANLRPMWAVANRSKGARRETLI
jgi:lysophospholipase L1-like esterase